MPTLETNAAYWRERAQAARAKAARMVQPGSRDALMGVAETFERMATFAERSSAKRPALERPQRD